MGRSGRSRKRKDAMNRIKRERNAKKELARLKKTLGLVDADGNDIKMELDEIAEVKTAAQLKKVNIFLIQNAACLKFAGVCNFIFGSKFCRFWLPWRNMFQFV